jgi:hypothetical protein
MNQVDIYIGDYRLDLFQDEEISISLNVQNIQDLSKIFTDFTQSFTIPATAWNNEVLHHYYRTDVDSSQITKRTIVDNSSAVMGLLGYVPDTITETSAANSFDFRLRPSARIEINSLPFRTGVIEMENVLMKGTEPYSYSLSFYGDLVSLTDLFGEDYLYDLDLSAYDHTYDGATILQGFNSDALFSGDVFYPLMSPVRNWVYNVSNSSDPRHEDDIRFVTGHSGHHHGLHYNELKPAVKVVKILEAIEAKYGINFTGDFMSDTQFNKLYLWAHRFEGQLYDNASVIDWQLINMNRNTGSGSQFNLTTDTWTVASTSEYQLRVQVLNSSANYELGLFRNGVEIGIAREDANAGTNTTFFDGYILNAGDEVQLKIRPQLPVNMTYQVTDYTAYTASDGIPITQQFEVDQSLSASYAFELAMSPLMPEIKIKDFLSGIVKMHNLVIVPTNATTFNLQTLNDWYSGGVSQDLSSYINIEEASVNRPPLYREISFDYQDTEQILGYEYQRTNVVGFGDLNAFFSWDGEEYKVELPFECPLFERLTDIDAGTLTNILVYKSQTREIDTEYENRFQPYVGNPILIYGEFSLDITPNPISFVDESNTETQVNEVWYANTSSTSTGTGAAYALTWGSDIDPYHLAPIGKSLYQTYWEDYITDLYDSNRRVLQVEAILPLGKILNLQLNNKIIWNNQRWIVNSADVNMTTGKTAFELLNDV